MTGVRPGLLGLLACAAAAWAQAPTPEQTGAAIEVSRKVALAYAGSLPDFICTQLVYRYVDAAHPRIPSWRALDILTIQLNYFDQREDHKLLLVDGKPVKSRSRSGRRDIGGGIRPHAAADFRASLASGFHLAEMDQGGPTAGRDLPLSGGRVPLQILVELPGPRGTHSDRSRVPRHIGSGPRDGRCAEPDFDCRCGSEDLPHRFLHHEGDLRSRDVGGRQYLLPASSEVEMHSRDLRAWNRAQFRNYRKFSADSAVHFGDAK